MSTLATKSLLPAFLKTLGILYFYIFVGLLLDSPLAEQYLSNPQEVANGIMLVVFSIVMWRSTTKTRELLVYAVIIGFVGEYLFSILLGMYTYRLNNIPHYIPPAHALVYLGVLLFSKNVGVKQHKLLLEKIFTVIIIGYATLCLAIYTDVFGFVLTVATLLILRNKPRERLFYLTMYVTVAYLEFVGTGYKCWYWPSTAFDYFTFLPSANAPSGISFFYFGLDLGCLWLYKKRHKLAWGRMKMQRQLRLERG